MRPLAWIGFVTRILSGIQQNVRSYYILNHRIRGLLFHYKKKLSGNWLLFFGNSIQRHPDSVCENDVNN